MADGGTASAAAAAAEAGMSSKERRALKDKVGTRMKVYENEHNPKLDPGLPFVVRLDGHGFSKFTQGLVKPFDCRLSGVMVATMLDVAEHFGAMSGYTGSDEISLVFRSVDVEAGQTLAYSGKVVKLCSLMAGYTSVRFNVHMAKLDWSDLSERTQERIGAMQAYFDARAFSLPDAEEVAANIQWRSNYDMPRNSVSMLARAHYSAKALNGVSTHDAIAMLRAEVGVEWDDQPNFFRFGTMAKKELYVMQAVNPKTGEAVEAMRSRWVARSFRFDGPASDYAPLLLAKHWPDTFDPAGDTVLTVDDILASPYSHVGVKPTADVGASATTDVGASGE